MKQRLSPEDNRRAWLLAALIVLMMSLAAVGGFLLLTAQREEEPMLFPSSEALVEASRELDAIRITGMLAPGARTLTFTQEMTLRNRTGQDQSAVTLRSWSGAYLSADTSPCATEELFYECYGAAFSPGGLTVEAASVDGQAVEPVWLDEARTVLSLPASWAEGAAVTVSLGCTVRIPDCRSRFGYAEKDGAAFVMLGNVFPTAAVWEDGAWRMDAYGSIGDPFLSECANWHVTLTLPEGWTAAASAPAAQNEGGPLVFDALAMRDFALVASDGFTFVDGMAGDVRITAAARTEKNARAMLKTARQAFSTYEKRWGDYAYPAFTVAEVIFPYGGMEYPGLAMIDSDTIGGGGQMLEYVVAHETAHQWWAVMVGSDGFYQPWQDESLCEYAWLDYVGDWYGASDRERMAFDRIETSQRITIPGQVTPGSPIDYFSALDQYSRVVYQRGAALWCALENFLGKDALDDMLRDYQAAYRFQIASREDLTAIINRHAGQDMSGLMLDYLDTLMK